MSNTELTVEEIVRVAEGLWPLSGAEPWDAVGLISGNLKQAVTGIHLAVDAVPEVASEAISLGAQVLLVHHPLLLRGVTTVAEDRFKGAVLSQLIRASCALYCAHTNADVVATGTSSELAKRLGLVDCQPISAVPGTQLGIGRVGRLAEPVTLGRLARQLAQILPATASGIRVSGEFDQPIENVALCAGSGDSYLEEPLVLASDVYISSDLRHHPASAFRETAKLNGGPALIDISHWAAEWIWLETAAAELRERLPGVNITVSEIRTDPWDFAIVQ